MLAILFPHMFEDIEYLLPEGQLEGNASAPSSQESRFLNGSQSIIYPNQQVNGDAVAGPSRLSRA
jgi:E3 ubiquitin-protein ligase SHPRH